MASAFAGENGHVHAFLHPYACVRLWCMFEAYVCVWGARVGNWGDATRTRESRDVMRLRPGKGAHFEGGVLSIQLARGVRRRDR